MFYVVYCHLSISDIYNKEEIHCEDIAVAFRNGEGRWLAGLDRTYYYQHADILYWIKRNVAHILDERKFEVFSNHCVQEGKEVYKKFKDRDFNFDAMVLEEKHFQEIKDLENFIVSLNSGNKDTIYSNEFN